MRLRLLASVCGLAVLAACGGSTGPSTMRFSKISPANPKIGDVVEVDFELIDDRGLPMAGQDVTFELQGNIQSANPGVELAPLKTVSLKGTGVASTFLTVKSRVTSVIIVAKSGTKTVLSPPISIAGSVPNGKQFTFQCGEIAGDASGGRHAIGAYDAARTLIAGEKLNCTAHVGDRNGDGVADALVSFMTEAGAIGPTEVSLTNVVGNATVLHKTSLPLPKDVDPDKFSWTPLNDATHTGDYLAPTWMEPFTWIANPLTWPRPATATMQEPSRIDPVRKAPSGAQIRNNPRDNVVSMIAVTAGEEGYIDANNNGTWDTGEQFDDLTEPFVDANDNGTWDADERFIDVNGNKQWDGKNGQWDANTLIWVQERILWTGIPHALDTVGAAPVLKAVAPATAVNMVCPGSGTVCNQAQDQATGAAWVTFNVYVSDPWYNCLAQDSDGDGCDLVQQDQSPITSSLSKAFGGYRVTYPAGDFITVVINDKRNPNATDNPPKRVPAVQFYSPVICHYTSSPLQGNQVTLNVSSVQGTIE